MSLTTRPPWVTSATLPESPNASGLPTGPERSLPGQRERVDELQGAPPVREPGTHRPAHIEATDHSQESSHLALPRSAEPVAALDDVTDSVSVSSVC